MGGLVLRDKLMVDERIDLTDALVDGCKFDGCVLILRREGHAVISNTHFIECQLLGDGWPPGAFQNGCFSS